MKNKIVAAILAFPFGVFGLHRFYLGQRFLGILYFLFFIFAIVATTSGGPPLVAIAGMVAFIDAILLYVMPEEDFNERYNRRRVRQNYQQRRTDYVAASRQSYDAQNLQYFKRKGIDAFRNYDYEDAIYNFNKALDYRPDDPALHFNLACCHSMVEEREDAFFHLEKAIEYGFDDIEKIHHHEALSYLRASEDFDLFVENDYKLTDLPLPAKPDAQEGEEDLLEQLEKSRSQELLDKLKQLSELRDKGILTEEEFAEQKRRLLNNEE